MLRLFVVLFIGLTSFTLKAQGSQYCYGGTCHQTLAQAQAALRAVNPAYAPYIRFAGTGSIRSDGKLIYQYRVGDQPAKQFYAPVYAVTSYASSTPGCTGMPPHLDHGCTSEDAALESFLSSGGLQSCSIQSSLTPAGSYRNPYNFMKATAGAAGSYGYFKFIDYLGIASVAAWPPNTRDFRGFEFDGVCSAMGPGVKRYRIPIEKRLAFDCPAGFNPTEIASSASFPGQDIYSYKWCKPAQGYFEIVGDVRQVASCQLEGESCNPATGDKSFKVDDFSVSGRLFFRNYHSLGEFDDRKFSRGWSHSFSERVVAVMGVDPYFVSRGGHYEKTISLGNGKYGFVELPGALLEIVGVPGDVKYRVSYANGDVSEFNAKGSLISISNPDVPTSDLKFFYDGSNLIYIEDAQHRRVEFVYHSGAIQSISLPDGGIVRYQYDNSDALAGVIYPGGAVQQYHYGEQGLATVGFEHLLTGISMDGERLETFEYDQLGRIVSSRRSSGVGFYEEVLLSYTGADTVVVNRTGHQSTYKFGSAPYRAVLSVTDDGGQVSFVRMSNRLARKIDRLGGVTAYAYSSGFLSRIDEAVTTPFERRTELYYDSSWRLSRKTRLEIVGGTHVLRTAHSVSRGSRGEILSSCAHSSDSNAFDYTCGSHIDAINGVRQVSYKYCEQSDVELGVCPRVGLRLNEYGPRSDINDYTSYVYYPEDDIACVSAPSTCQYRKGDLWKVTNAKGQVTETLKYDGAGRVLSVKDPNGVITDFEYHPRGWLTVSKVRGTNDAVEADDAITRIDYWPTGLVKRVTQPDGAFTQYSYDPAHRLTDITDNAGNTIHYVLDNAGHRIAEETKDAGGVLKRSLSRLYNQLGQLATQADAQANPTDFSYDANSNLDAVTDALGRVTDHDHDPLNRLARTLQDVGGIAAETRFQYDALDQLTKVTDPKGLDTTYTYNGLGDLTQLQSPDTGTTTYTYDSAGNRATQTDARGVTTTYAYDVLNRLTAVSYPDTSLNVGYTYDATPAVCGAGETFSVGRLSGMDDASGSTRYCYNRFGHLVRKVQTTNGVSFVVRYAYTVGGNLQAMVYPDGTMVDYGRNAQGQVTEVGVTRSGQSRQVLLNQAAYHPFGPVAGWTYGNGRTLSRTLDQDYRPLTVEDPNTGGLSLGFGYDAVGNLTQLGTAQGMANPVIRFGYDALGRLTRAEDGPTQAAIDVYAYDATGNRTAHTTAAGTSAYTYLTTSHRLTEVAGVPRTYDAVGNTTAIGGARSFAYNDANRMSGVQQSGVTTRQYAYNGRGEQVRRYLGGTNTYTVYDEAGHWLGDYDDTGAPVQQALWMDDLPVGLLANGQQLHYLQPDHLGSPRVVIEAARNVPVWTWDLKGEVFGNTAPQQDPDGDGVPFVLDMRFPGQRYDAASMLNYNYFRDYDASTGRYAQSDPIGLDGGVNTYAYVDGKPLSWIDLMGLQKFSPPPRLNRPGGGNAHQRAIWNKAQLRAIQNNSHSTPINTRGLTPEQVSSAENIASIATGNDYSNYCAVEVCRQDTNKCQAGDVITSWVPSPPTVAQVNARGCVCADAYFSGMAPLKEPSAGWGDLFQLISDYLKRR
ncbi:RHS repeat-associated core domain-containing protein [Pseudoxanthomonas beigongshangi]